MQSENICGYFRIFAVQLIEVSDFTHGDKFIPLGFFLRCGLFGMPVRNIVGNIYKIAEIKSRQGIFDHIIKTVILVGIENLAVKFIAYLMLNKVCRDLYRQFIIGQGRICY